MSNIEKMDPEKFNVQKSPSDSPIKDVKKNSENSVSDDDEQLLDIEPKTSVFNLDEAF